MAGTLIQIRRGTSSARPTLVVGEFGLDVDTGDVWIGSPSGNRLVGTSLDYNFTGTFANPMFVGSVYSPQPDWTTVLGTKFGFLANETAFVSGGVAVLPVQTTGYSELNLFHSPAGTRGQGVIQWMHYSTNASKWINTFAIGNDVVQPMGTHGVQPVLFIGARSVSGALPNDFYDLMSITGYDFQQTGVGSRYRGEIALGMAPGLVGHAITAASPSSYREDYGVFSVFRAKEGTGVSSSPYITCAHGTAGYGKWILGYNGEITWYGSNASNDPFNGDGMNWAWLGIDGNSRSNDPQIRCGYFQIQAKRSADAGISQLTVGGDKVAINVPVQIGNVVSAVNPTSPNRTVTIVVNGTTLYLSAKTTND